MLGVVMPAGHAMPVIVQPAPRLLVEIWLLLQKGCLLSQQEKSAAILQQEPSPSPFRSLCWRKVIKLSIGCMIGAIMLANSGP